MTKVYEAPPQPSLGWWRFNEPQESHDDVITWSTYDVLEDKVCGNPVPLWQVSVTVLVIFFDVVVVAAVVAVVDVVAVVLILVCVLVLVVAHIVVFVLVIFIVTVVVAAVVVVVEVVAFTVLAVVR